MNLVYDTLPLEITQATNYLGVTLDKRLGWAPHVNNVQRKATDRLRILRRLTGTTWGANQDVLVTTYKSYIRPVLEYACEALSTASETTKQKLNVVQNNALRIVCGAAVSTPITALESQTRIEPLEARRDKALLRFFERSRRVGDGFWETYKTAKLRLVTQLTPLEKSLLLQNKYKTDFGERLRFPRPTLVKDRPNISACLNLPGIKDRKGDVLPQILKAATLDMLASIYPTTDWYHVYTDGSAMGENCGAGFYSSLAEGFFPVGKHMTNFDGEVAAICEAARRLVQLPGLKKVVFLSDSTAALQAITSQFPHDALVMACRDILSQLQERAEICLQWVPGHCDIDGNERADRLAKSGCDLTQEDRPISYCAASSAINLRIKKSIRTAWEAAAVGKRWETIVRNNAIPNSLPRGVAVATFRMATGHDYLQKHLYRIGLADTPLCPLCSKGEGTAEHLNCCDALEQADDDLHGRAGLYWEARRQMAFRPRAGVG